MLVEIKTPQARLLGQEDRNGVFPISPDLAKAISQVQVYCDAWNSNPNGKQEIETDYSAMTVSPKGIVVIGNTTELKTKEQKRAFELFKRDLTHIDVITYDELLERAKYILCK